MAVRLEDLITEVIRSVARDAELTARLFARIAAARAAAPAQSTYGRAIWDALDGVNEKMNDEGEEVDGGVQAADLPA